MDFEITPPIVNKQRDHYKSSFSDKFEIKQFTGVTKQECVMKRSEWIRHHPDRIIPPRRETLEKFIPTLTIPTGSKYGFRDLLPCTLYASKCYIRGRYSRGPMYLGFCLI